MGSGMPCWNELPELTDLDLLNRGDIRKISTQRKRKLQKRDDVAIWWSREINSWVWANLTLYRRI